MKFKKAVLINIADTHFDEKYWKQLDQLVDNRISLSRDDPKLMDELKECDVLMLGFQVPTGKDIFDAAPNLKLINILATAYGTIDLKIANQRGISVCNLAGYSTEAVAEFTIAILLYQIRMLEEGISRSKAGNYDFEGMSARELRGSKFGVVGLGSIGGRVAELASGFNAEVSYWSRIKKNDRFTFKGLDELLSESDYISLNVAQTPETENLLDSGTIGLIKSGAVVINTVPPEVVNTDAMAKRLAKKDITYITDHADEMSKTDLAKLKKFPNCILLPAIGFITQEARINKQEIFISNIRAALKGSPENTVQ